MRAENLVRPLIEQFGEGCAVGQFERLQRRRGGLPDGDDLVAIGSTERDREWIRRDEGRTLNGERVPGCGCEIEEVRAELPGRGFDPAEFDRQTGFTRLTRVD